MCVMRLAYLGAAGFERWAGERFARRLIGSGFCMMETGKSVCLGSV